MSPQHNLRAPRRTCTQSPSRNWSGSAPWVGKTKGGRGPNPAAWRTQRSRKRWLRERHSLLLNWGLDVVRGINGELSWDWGLDLWGIGHTLLLH